MHHGLPHHPLPTACVWAKVPPHDPPLHGNGNQAVRHVHRRWPQRLCWLWLHASGMCVSLEANAGVISWFSSLGVKDRSLILLRYKMWSFSPMADQLLTPPACQDSRFSAMARETATTPPRSNTWRTKGYEDTSDAPHIHQHRLQTWWMIEERCPKTKSVQSGGGWGAGGASEAAWLRVWASQQLVYLPERQHEEPDPQSLRTSPQ